MAGKRIENGEDSRKLPRLGKRQLGDLTIRLSPTRSSPTSFSPGSSPRTSPGLVAGHYAGCKWSEPPSPACLPLPPSHWMMSTSTFSKQRKFKHQFHKQMSDKSTDIGRQMKVLLDVQA